MRFLKISKLKEKIIPGFPHSTEYASAPQDAPHSNISSQHSYYLFNNEAVGTSYYTLLGLGFDVLLFMRTCLSNVTRFIIASYIANAYLPNRQTS